MLTKQFIMKQKNELRTIQTSPPVMALCGTTAPGIFESFVTAVRTSLSQID